MLSNDTFTLVIIKAQSKTYHWVTFQLTVYKNWLIQKSTVTNVYNKMNKKWEKWCEIYAILVTTIFIANN